MFDDRARLVFSVRTPVGERTEEDPGNAGEDQRHRDSGQWPSSQPEPGQ